LENSALELVDWHLTDEQVAQAVANLQAQGVVLLRGILDKQELSPIVKAATGCFMDIERIIRDQGADQVSHYVPPSYAFNARSTSVSLFALNDYQSSSEAAQMSDKVLFLLSKSLAYKLLTQVMGNRILCNLAQAWVRKQYAHMHDHDLHAPHSWHQDGALGVTFSNLPDKCDRPYSREPLTPLITCWIPLTTCGRQSPGIQLITQHLEQLVYYTYLNKVRLLELFDSHQFWSPEMTLGDVLIFLNGTLHQTYLTQSMKQDRLSLELRLMGSDTIPQWMKKDVFKELSDFSASNPF
jgi:ectoine hydroxylase-related dioxygenase (phytanoyl-CoA dioxygenase family)